jgi:hypothetical protein
VEGLYTNTINDLLYRNLRIEPVPGAAQVEGRTLYRNRANTPGLGDVIDVTNTGEGYTYSLTGQVQRPFRGGWDFSLAYTYSRAMDTAPLNNSTAFSNWSFNLTQDDPNNPGLTRSDNDIPHRIVATTSRRFELIRRLATDLSLVYVGQSGLPYSYRYGSDINGDGSTGNDLFYVPRDASDIRFQETAGISAAQSYRNLNRLIEDTECLRENRGEVLERNSCRAPWTNRFDFRLAQNISTFGRQSAQFTVDILNVGNLLNSDWGRSDFISNQADNALFLATGSGVNNSPDAQGRRLYGSFAPRSDRFTTSNLDSRYQIQLGLRYSF